MLKWPIGYFELGISVFLNDQLVEKLPIGDFEKQQSPIQNHQLVISTFSSLMPFVKKG